MNILFLSLSKFENLEEKQIYNDIFKELSLRGYNISIICPQINENKNDNSKYENITIHRVGIKDVRNVGPIKKGIRTLLLSKYYQRVIDEKIDVQNIDVIMYSTPPITFNKIIEVMKRKNPKLRSVLILKDIFPQNAIDLKYFKKGSIIHKYFSSLEKKLYQVSDKIGCMSEGNVKYLLAEHPSITPDKLFIFRNSLYKNTLNYESEMKEKIFDKYLLDPSLTTFIYGGNLGRPQYIKGIQYFISNFHYVPSSQLIIIGDGAEFESIKKFVEESGNSNIHVFKKVSKLEFDEILKFSDVGLIFLDPNFTIPNFPSRFSSYLDFERPVLAATDRATDIKDEIEKNEVGYWNYAEDGEKLIKNAIKISDKNLRSKMSKNAKVLFEKKYEIEKNVDVLIKEIEKIEKEF